MTRILKHDKELRELLRELKPAEPRSNRHAAPPNGVGLSDDEVIERARREKNGKFECLWNGDLSDYNADHSRADNGFVYKLYFYTQDEEQIRRIHARSGLARDKSLDRDGYLQYSLDKAREEVTEFYSPRRDSHSHSLSSNVSEGTHESVKYLVQSIKATTLRGRAKPAPRGWIVDNHIWERHAACWYGEGGVAKSLLAMHLATHVASPEFTEWLGDIPIKTAPVLCLDFELDESEQHRRLYEIAQGLDLDDVPEDLYYIGATEYPPSAVFAAAAREVERLGVKLVIVDSVGFAVEGDAEIAKDILSFHRTYLEPLKAAGASPLLIDHQAKIVKGEKYSDKTAFGSVYKTNAVRSMFQVRGGKNEGGGMTATFRHTKNNFGSKEDEFFVEVKFDMGRTEVAKLGEAVPDPTREPTMEDRVLEALELEEATAAELAKILGEKDTSVANAVARLKKDGKVEPTGEKRGRAQVLRVPSLTLLVSECESESQPEEPNPRVVNIKSGEPFDVYIGRGGGHTGQKKSDWHNPFKVGEDGTREEVIEMYERYLTQERPDLMERLPGLKGKTLGCHCAPQACHGDVLLRLIAEGDHLKAEAPSLGDRESAELPAFMKWWAAERLLGTLHWRLDKPNRLKKREEERRINAPARYHDLPINEKISLRAWVRDSLAPQRRPMSSYALKHAAEKALSFYVGNGEIKGAMLEAGYPVLGTRGPNEYYQAGPRQEETAK